MSYMPIATRSCLDSYQPTKAINRMEELYSELQEADSTSARRYRYNQMVELWEKYPILHNIWNFMSDMFNIVERFVKIINVAITAGNRIIWFTTNRYDKGVNQVYLIRCVNDNGEVIYSKFGTTTRETEKRMREHLRYYAKDGVTAIYVDRVWDCGDIDPEGLESEFRARYIKKYKGCFKRNDRFVNTIFDLDEAEEIVNDYIG